MANKFPEWLKSLGTRRADLPPAVRGQAVRHTIRWPGDQTSAVLVGTIKATPDATSELAIWSVGAGVFDGTDTRWEVSLTGGQTLALPSDNDFSGTETFVYDFLITQGGFTQRVFGGLFTLSGFVTEDGTTPAPPPDPEEIGQFVTDEELQAALDALEFATDADVAAAIAALDVYTTSETDAAIAAAVSAIPGGSDISAISFFGDGSDGDVTISSGVTTITRDMYYNNLTISGTGQLNTSQYRVFVKGTLDISAAPANAIYAGNGSGSSKNGANATTSPGGTGASGGNLATQRSLGNGNGGGSGGSGGTGTGAQAAAAATQSNSQGGLSGAGGGGGAVGATNGGASRAATAQTSPVDIKVLKTDMATVFSGAFVIVNAGSGGPGGSAGAGDGVGSGGGGGGGGAGGGFMFLAANTINRSGSTSTGAISVVGGNGGNGGLGSGGTNRGGGGGGAGGGGGWLYLIYGQLTGSTATNCLDIRGGNGGDGGNGTGTGNGGNGGGSGAGGRLNLYNLGAGTQTIVNGSASVAGSAASGGTGGAGATAAADLVSL
jgi:hypothetical protein